MARRRWIVRRSQFFPSSWMAYPEDHAERTLKGWVFSSWQDAMDYANSNGRRTEIPRSTPARFE